MQGFPCGGEKAAARWIQPTRGEGAEGHVGVGGAPLAQVHLNRLDIPVSCNAAGDEIHPEAFQGTFGGQGLTHSQAVVHQHPAVGAIGRKAAAEVGLATWSAEDLFMGGEHLHRAAGMDEPLHARGAQALPSLQPGLHQGPLLRHPLPPAQRRHWEGFQSLPQPLSPFWCREFMER